MTVTYLDTGSLGDVRAIGFMVAGFTTNPSLMLAAGVTNYESWARDLLESADGKPVSFEVTGDNHDEMLRQAMVIHGWHPEYAVVKIPAVTTSGVPNDRLIADLCARGVPVNVTAVFTTAQIDRIYRAVSPYRSPTVISVFAGRIADTGRDPAPFVRHAVDNAPPGTLVLWASAREAFNFKQARLAGADIITMPRHLLEKMWGQDMADLKTLSVMTVQQFYEDARDLEVP